MQAERDVEASMDFIILSLQPSTVNKPTISKLQTSIRPSEEEQEMWENHASSNKIFDAGVDHTAAAVEEREHLEKEADNFSLWRGADFLPEDDPNGSELLLEEMEQDDIMSELLRNARTNAIQLRSTILTYIIFVDRYRDTGHCRPTG